MEFDGARRPGSERRPCRVDLVVNGPTLVTWRRNKALALPIVDFPRDPDFERKAKRVLDLYGRMFDGVALGPDDYVISADEKPQLQALARCHPGLGCSSRRVRRVEFEYKRGGTLAYMGAYDVHRACLIGNVAAKTGIVPFTELVERVMTMEPYASVPKVYWIVDNGSSHNGQPSIDRMNTAWPTAQLVHLHVLASWLNQIEIVFSVIQRKVIKPADFADLKALKDRLERFTDHYNTTARPFDWRFTSSDLTAMLERLDAHEPSPVLIAA